MSCLRDICARKRARSRLQSVQQGPAPATKTADRVILGASRAYVDFLWMPGYQWTPLAAPDCAAIALLVPVALKGWRNMPVNMRTAAM